MESYLGAEAQSVDPYQVKLAEFKKLFAEKGDAYAAQVVTALAEGAIKQIDASLIGGLTEESKNRTLEFLAVSRAATDAIQATFPNWNTKYPDLLVRYNQAVTKLTTTPPVAKPGDVLYDPIDSTVEILPGGKIAQFKAAATGLAPVKEPLPLAKIALAALVAFVAYKSLT